jgi:hypothetical protein
MLQEETGIDLATLSARQLDGYACVKCGGETGPVVTINLVLGIQHIVHSPGHCKPLDKESAA